MPNIFAINLSKDVDGLYYNNNNNINEGTKDVLKDKVFYHPPFSYQHSGQAAVLRLKRYLHDLNYSALEVWFT